MYSHLLSDGIIVRDRSNTPGCGSALRLTVGTPQENDAVIRSVERYCKKGDVLPGTSDGSEALLRQILSTGNRHSVLERTTGETHVFIEVDLDGNGKSDVSTGLKFFDHMLSQIPSPFREKIIA